MQAEMKIKVIFSLNHLNISVLTSEHFTAKNLYSEFKFTWNYLTRKSPFNYVYTKDLLGESS